jgi:hypothetical protein
MYVPCNQDTVRVRRGQHQWRNALRGFLFTDDGSRYQRHISAIDAAALIGSRCCSNIGANLRSNGSGREGSIGNKLTLSSVVDEANLQACAKGESANSSSTDSFQGTVSQMCHQRSLFTSRTVLVGIPIAASQLVNFVKEVKPSEWLRDNFLDCAPIGRRASVLVRNAHGNIEQ